jgi:FKBP12-rapamycin complex-associated protein
MPSFLNVLRTADVGFREYLFQQLAILIAIVKQHIRNYLDDVFALVREFWTWNSPLQSTLIHLVEHVAVALGAEFKIYLPRLMPQVVALAGKNRHGTAVVARSIRARIQDRPCRVSQILRVLSHDTSKERQVTVKLLLALQKFAGNLDNYLHLVLPPVVRLFQASPDCPVAVSRCALETVEQLAESLDFTDFASRIVQPLVRTLDQCPELRSPACETLCALLLQLGPKFQIFLPLVQRAMARHRIVHSRFESLVDKVQSEARLGGQGRFEASEHDHLLLSSARQRQARSKSQRAELGLASAADTTVIKKLNVSASNLQKAWMATRRVSKDDWLEWLRSLSIGTANVDACY